MYTYIAPVTSDWPPHVSARSGDSLHTATAPVSPHETRSPPRPSATATSGGVHKHRTSHFRLATAHSRDERRIITHWQPSAIVRVEGGNFTSHRPLHIGRHTFQRGASIHCTLLLHLYHHRRYAVLLGRQPRQPVREVHLLCIGHFRVAATRFSEERRFTTQCYGTCIITGDTQSS